MRVLVKIISLWSLLIKSKRLNIINTPLMRALIQIIFIQIADTAAVHSVHSEVQLSDHRTAKSTVGTHVQCTSYN